MAEHKEEHIKAEKKDEIKIPKSSLKIAAIVIIVLIIGFFIGFSSTGMLTGAKTVNSLPQNEVGQKVVKYLNDNLVQPGTNASLVSVGMENGLYKIVTSYQGRDIPIYATQDGSQMFLSAPVLINETVAKQTQTATETPKTDKPSAELFVMAFCPYGVQAENMMKPVIDLLGSKADIKIRFITNIGGDTVDSVQSLHGAPEAEEDLRQVCIAEKYPEKYWSYLMDMNQNCYPNYRNATALDACWKAAATKLGMNTTTIDTCSKGEEGLNLLRLDEQAASSYDVSGSPTLIINGVQYSGSRTSEAYKSAICAAFTTTPAECGQAINSTMAAAPEGGCAT